MTDATTDSRFEGPPPDAGSDEIIARLVAEHTNGVVGIQNELQFSRPA